MKLTPSKLIEASAGTGKTYTLVREVIGLLALGVNVQELLIVTYTVNAAQELRERIYKEIMLKLLAFDSMPSTKTKSDRPTARKERDYFKKAVDDFSLLRISTIHSFTLSVLTDYPLLCNYHLFQNTIFNPENDYQIFANKFYHNYLQSSSPIVYQASKALQYNVQHLITLIQYATTLNKVRLFDQSETRKIDQAEIKKFITAQKKFEKDLHRCLTADSTALKKRELNKINKELLGAEFCFLSQKKFDEIKKIVEGLPQKKSNDQSTLNNCISNFLQVQIFFQNQLLHHFLYLDQQFLVYCKQEITKKIFRDHQISYSYMLEKTTQAIEESADLRKRIQEKYRVALVDEFQDTDSYQWQIFSLLFLDSQAEKPLTLILVGDPKQSIYAFRGANLHIYLQARTTLQKNGLKIQNLTSNYRSTDFLIRGLNYLYQRMKNPFSHEQIKYHPINAKSNLTNISPAIEFIYLQYLEKKKKKSELRYQCGLACAQKILQLVRDYKANLNDIAILSYQNNQANLIHQALQTANIKSRLMDNSSVFQSETALAFYQLLVTLLDPLDLSSMRLLYATIFFSEGEILAEAEMAHFRERLFSYQQMFMKNENPWYTLLEKILYTEKIREKLVKLGKNHLANLEKLLEILIYQQGDQSLDKVGKFLEEYIHSPLSSDQLQRELGIDVAQRFFGDEQAVSILTVFRAKGLEFEYVLLPFLWDQRDSKQVGKEKFLSHYDMKDDQYICYPQYLFKYSLARYQEKSKVKANPLNVIASASIDDQIRESRRLLYVQLTRAKKQVSIITPPLISLQSMYGGLDLRNPFLTLICGEQTTEQQLENSQLLLLSLQGIVKWNHEIFSLQMKKKFNQDYGKYSSTSTIDAKPKLVTPPKIIHEGIQIISYSKIVHSQSASILDARDYQDDSSLQKKLTEEASFCDLLNFPAGAHAGTFFHTLLQDYYSREQVAGKNQIASAIKDNLEKNQFDGRWLNPLLEFFQMLDHKQLTTDGFRLEKLDQRLIEMPFYFHLNETVIHGFIDFIFSWQNRFYWIDWKSNYLGASLIDYQKDDMLTSIKQNSYDVQYLIYSEAVDRFLQYRIKEYSYEQHFGGLFYIFLRGINTQNDNGIWFHRPDAAKIKALRKKKMSRSEFLSYADFSKFGK